MDWLKNLVNNLPLETISEYVAKIVLWWSNLVKDIPANELPFLAYVGASVLVLILLLLVIRILPRPLGGILWVFSAAVLLTPGDTLVGTGQIAPAIAGVAHSILMGEIATAISLFLPILIVFTVLLFVGTIWQILYGMIEVSIAKAKETARLQEKKRLMAELDAQKNNQATNE